MFACGKWGKKCTYIGTIIKHLGSIPFFGRVFNFFQIGRGTVQNKNLHWLFPLRLYPLTSIRIKPKPTEKIPPPMKQLI